jgi:wyosine [tRNA(Phe)-imidazoG37] synthetase (radical SAM superfamily)
VASRRFGLSLGIDLSPDEKACNFDCLYCELKPAAVTDTIKNPPPVDAVIEEVQNALKAYSDVDVITITANGEPTLYPYLDALVDGLNRIKGDKKLLILSNASTIADEKIKQILRKIDIVKLSLDCATPACFKKIDRPLKSVEIEKIIEGIKAFRKLYDKDLIIEVLVIAGVNDKPEEMEALGRVLDEIDPDRIDLGTIDRPPAYDVKAVSTQRLKELSHYLGHHNISIMHKERSEKTIDFSDEEIIATLARRPQSASDVAYLFSDKAKERLQKLLEAGSVVQVNIAGVLFYRVPETLKKRSR